MPTIILAIDPAIHSGYCVVSVSDDKELATIYDYGIIDIDIERGQVGDHCNQMFDQTISLIEKHKPDVVVVEEYFFSGRFASGANLNPMLRAAVHMAANRRNIKTEILNVSQWKSFIAGRSIPTKLQIKQWTKEAAKKLFIQQALWEKYSIRFPNFSISPNTGKPIFFRFDVVDAVGQAVCYSLLHFNARRIRCTVSVPPDYLFKKMPKKIFNYPS